MDSDRFDQLTRTLSAAGSRRRALALALSGALAPLLAGEDAAAHEFSKKCKKLKGDKKKKCLKKAKAHAAQHTSEPPPGVTCTPNCGGKDCGPNGCSGTCGPCPGTSTCANGLCGCPAGRALCKGDCVVVCNGQQSAFDPTTCGCCGRPGTDCSPATGNPNCCSRTTCIDAEPVGTFCDGQREGEPCEFDGQCYSALCRDGVCRCPSGKEVCKGVCYDPCWQDQTRKLNCNCCVRNGQACGSPADCCSEDCEAGTCVGIPAGEPCEFNAQCANNRFCDTVCGGVIGT